MHEPATASAESHVRDDVRLLARIGKCVLEGSVECARHDQRTGLALLAKESRQPGDEHVDGTWLVLGVEKRVQLVVERPNSLRQERVLGRLRERS